MAVSGLDLVSSLGRAAGALEKGVSPAASEGGESEFRKVLSEALEKFGEVGGEDAKQALDLLTGNTDDLTDTMVAAKKSEIAVSLAVAIRNRAIEAYKEIMNMQV